MFTFIIGTGGGNPVIPTTIWDSQVYLQVTADGVALSPRVQLTSNPYAFKAEKKETQNGYSQTQKAFEKKQT